MGTLVCFHAHPDDESISTGGSIARASAEGHRVVLVVATNGDHGEVPDDLAPGETLVDRRKAETARSAEVLGVHRLVWLGYADSGMTGWPQNEHPDAFWQAPVDEAAERLAAVLREESADVLTVYDWHGNYGHPDHIQVHRVGHRAAELAGTPRVFEATMNRDHIVRMMTMAREMGQGDGAAGPEVDFDPAGPADDGNPFGMSEAELTHAVEVVEWMHLKRASMRCHSSQITDSSFFLEMPDEAFAGSFGIEWFIERGVEPGLRTGWLFE
jgi:LmbE family N-acetylglucosaminyl deacetylase